MIAAERGHNPSFIITGHAPQEGGNIGTEGLVKTEPLQARRASKPCSARPKSMDIAAELRAENKQVGESCVAASITGHARCASFARDGRGTA